MARGTDLEILNDLDELSGKAEQLVNLAISNQGLDRNILSKILELRDDIADVKTRRS